MYVSHKQIFYNVENQQLDFILAESSQLPGDERKTLK